MKIYQLFSGNLCEASIVPPRVEFSNLGTSWLKSLKSLIAGFEVNGKPFEIGFVPKLDCWLLLVQSVVQKKTAH